MKSILSHVVTRITLSVFITYLGPNYAFAEVPVLGSCKESATVTEAVKVTEGVQFSPSGFWHELTSNDKPFSRGEAISEDGGRFLALFRDCRQGISSSQECYYVWAGEIPRRKGLKIELTMFRDEMNCLESYTQEDIDAYIAEQKEEERRLAEIKDRSKEKAREVDLFNDECIFQVMPRSPNELISQSITQLCGYLAERFANSGLMSVRLFVIKGDLSTSRLVCYVTDSWGRSDPAFLESASNRCDRFAESGGKTFIQNYPIDKIPNLNSLLESAVLRQESH